MKNSQYIFCFLWYVIREVKIQSGSTVIKRIVLQNESKLRHNVVLRVLQQVTSTLKYLKHKKIQVIRKTLNMSYFANILLNYKK